MVATETTIDASVLYEQAQSVLELVLPGATISPMEPTDSDPSGAAMALTGTVDEHPAVFLIDAIAGAEEFTPAEIIAALSETVSESLSLEAVELGSAPEPMIAVLADATLFRAAVANADTELGELRFAAALLEPSDDSVSESVDVDPDGAEPTGDAEPDSAEPTGDAEPDSAEPTGDAEADVVEPTGDAEPDGAETPPVRTPDRNIAERLPNLASVDMSVAVELGRVRLPIRELLGLGAGSVVRLGTPVGESFDILVNGKTAARGDLVVVGGRLAVRIRELLGIEG